MKASFHRSWFYLGSVALVMVASGCVSDRTRDARSPGRSETFESRAPEASDEGPARPVMAPDYHAMHDDPLGMHGRPRPGLDAAFPGQPQTDLLPDPRRTDTSRGEMKMNHLPDQQEPRSATLAPRSAGQDQTAAGEQVSISPDAMSERQLCQQLAAAGRLEVQDIENGVRIIIAPKTAAELAAVRETAQRIESRMQPGSAAAPRGEPSTQCKLFEVGQLGARASIQERPNQIHLILTTTDTLNVTDVRREARAFVATGSPAPPATPSKPSK
ncbi:hypothetical protein [Chondromyces apiculatus]|uniref:Uncharacterized protein n=1 Tax=Chondromyces apiculatus DSM 436 TaxID=1192034 RepID=A0A017SZX3_9BACT|nr:hypothetical protein [Chondromyces apiculatus]EYF02513.1 Hypothetical protein CAP_6720 [Chondromyces apiculatus DSM 436]